MPNEYIEGKKKLIIASRKSDLARLQSYSVGKALLSKFPRLKIDYHFRESLGDINLNDPLWKMPEKGVFTQDFYQDLIGHKVDLVVHSWKDLPVEENSQTAVIGTLKREDSRDILLYKKGSFNKKQPSIFTSSPRRMYNLEPFFFASLPWSLEKVNFVSVRGNIQTRIKKLLESEVQDGLILAKAALDRLLTVEEEEFQHTRNFIRKALIELAFQIIPLSQNPTAAAQGALAIEVAKERVDVSELIAKINDENTFYNVNLERTELKKYGGGCHQKIGISVINKEKFQVVSLRGLTDNNQVLNYFGLKRDFSNSSAHFPEISCSTKILAPHEKLKKTINSFNGANKLETPDINNYSFLFVTKPEALGGLFPENKINNKILNNKIIWTSGFSTWKSLAQKGVWVSGCFDSLGEESAPEIHNLLSVELKPKWLKLTHDKGNSSPWADTYTTYSAEYDLTNLEFDPEVELYFWSHGELFKKYLELFPEIKNKKHFCGLGSSLKVIQEYIPEKQIYPVLSFQEWKHLINSKKERGSL